MRNGQSLGPAGFAAAAAAASVAVYLVLAALVFGDAPGDVVLQAAATAVGVGIGTFYVRRGDAQ